MNQTTQYSVGDMVTECSHCGVTLTGPYCAECGQKVRERLTLRTVAAWWARYLSLEKGAVHTSVELMKRPGAVINDYIRGRTKPYSNPIQYYLLMMTIWQLAVLWSGGLGDIAQGYADGAGEGGRQGEFVEIFSTYFVVGLSGLVFVWTLLSRLVFFKSGLNLAEQAVFYLYFFGLYALYQSFVFVFIAIADHFWGVLIMVASLIIWLIQVIRAAWVNFGGKWWQSTLGSVAVLGAGLCVYVFIMLLGVIVFTKVL